MPVFVDLLTHAEGGDGQVVGQPVQPGFMLDFHALAAHIFFQVRAKLGVSEVIFAGLHNQPGAAYLPKKLDHAGRCLGEIYVHSRH